MSGITAKMFAGEIRKAGLEPVVDSGYWLVEGGRRQVHVIPTSLSNVHAYVRALPIWMHCSLQDVITLATASFVDDINGRPRLSRADKRKQDRVKHRAKPASKKVRLMARSNGGPRCGYCRCRLTNATATLDHVIPLSRGGTNAIKNLTLACFACNNKKGDRMPNDPEWHTLLRQAAALSKLGTLQQEPPDA